MTTTATPTTDPITASADARFGPTFVRFLRRAWLAAAAGGVAGCLVGGVGGRLAMFVLRLTSDGSVRGAESDDGFIIGRVSFATIFLLLVTTALGSVAALAYLGVRPAFPARARRACWAAVCGAIGGASIVHGDGIDFRVLEPASLAIALFVAIPAAGGWSMAYLIDRWEPWWARDRRRTAIASLWALPASIGGVGIVAGVAIVASAGAALISRIGLLRRAGAQLVLRGVVCIGVGALTVFALADLTDDVRTLL